MKEFLGPPAAGEIDLRATGIWPSPSDVAALSALTTAIALGQRDFSVYRYAGNRRLNHPVDEIAAATYCLKGESIK